MKTITVCKDCTDRFVGCHGTCQRYIEEKKALTETYRAINQQIKKENDYTDFLIKSKQRTIKYKGLSRYKKGWRPSD